MLYYQSLGDNIANPVDSLCKHEALCHTCKMNANKDIVYTETLIPLFVMQLHLFTGGRFPLVLDSQLRGTSSALK